ncbi:hypothetical protein [Zavarzinella formosa]|uniref:hypothetical protein n=1 Tax=Zavarzinella formosa TaxID=360055 RepID=UPI0002E38BA8|nr:hypothetical protein [Zavarzinella formosa]
MTAKVLEDFFCHEHNRLEVARQEYAAAKQHFREVMQNRIAGNTDHDRRFRDALNRQSAAREKLVELLTS